MKPLTTKERKFAELCVELGNQSEAYRQAYDVTNKDADWIKVKASQLASKDNISITIENLKEELRKEHKITKEWIIEQHKEIIDWYKELKELARQKNLSKEEKSRVYMLKDLIKGSDYRGSLDSITKMLGLNEPEKTDNTHTIKEVKVEIKRNRED